MQFRFASRSWFESIYDLNHKSSNIWITIHDLNRTFLPAPAPVEGWALAAAQFEGIFIHPLVYGVLTRVWFESGHQWQAVQDLFHRQDLVLPAANAVIPCPKFPQLLSDVWIFASDTFLNFKKRKCAACTAFGPLEAANEREVPLVRRVPLGTFDLKREHEHAQSPAFGAFFLHLIFRCVVTWFDRRLVPFDDVAPEVGYF